MPTTTGGGGCPFRQSPVRRHASSRFPHLNFDLLIMNDCSNFSFARVVRAVTPRGLLQHFAVLAMALLMAGTMTACDQLALDEAEPTNSISLNETISSRAGF